MLHGSFLVDHMKFPMFKYSRGLLLVQPTLHLLPSSSYIVSHLFLFRFMSYAVFYPLVCPNHLKVIMMEALYHLRWVSFVSSFAQSYFKQSTQAFLVRKIAKQKDLSSTQACERLARAGLNYLLRIWTLIS